MACSAIAVNQGQLEDSNAGREYLGSHFTPHVRVVNMSWESQPVAQFRRKIQWTNNKTISKWLQVSGELVRKGWTINISMYKISFQIIRIESLSCVCLQINWKNTKEVGQ